MKVSIIGAGVMGPGIAQVFLMGGHQVVLNDISEQALQKGKASIETSLCQMSAKGLLETEPESLLSLLSCSTDLKRAVADADIVIEAVPEQIEIKQSVYKDLDAYCPKDAIIASNTSSLPLPEIFPDFRPKSFCVAHFFNPPPVLPLVELVKNDRADPQKIAFLKETLEACGKTVVVVNQFIKGFLINRLQTALAREALYLVDQGVVSATDMDKACKAAIGFKSVWQGLFDTMDFIGLDTVAFVYDIIYPELSNAQKTPAIIHEMVRDGKLGTKSGEGFYRYDPETLVQVNEKRADMLLAQLKLWKQFNA